MKNLNGATISQVSKISKILVSLSIGLVLLLSFLGSTRTAFAEEVVPTEDIDDEIYFIPNKPDWALVVGSPVINGGSADWEGSGSSLSQRFYPGYGYVDVDLWRAYKLDTYTEYGFDYIYKGYLRIRDRVTFDIWCNNWNYTPCFSTEFRGLEIDATNYYASDRTNNIISSGSGSNTGSSGQSVQARIDSTLYFNDQPFSVSQMVTFHYRYRIFFKLNTYAVDGFPGFTFGSSYARVSGDYEKTNSVLVRTNSELYYLYNLQNGIITDNSGVSESLSGAANDLGIAESEADAVISEALPDASDDNSAIMADTALSGIQSVSTSLNFWKSLGNFILDMGESGFVAGILFFSLFAGLIVYLLRL